MTTRKIQIINADINVSKANYRDLAHHSLLVTSIFPTIQGEGPFAGTPSVFLRLAGCNIGLKNRCEFCDTKFFFDQGSRISISNVRDAIKEQLPHPSTKLVVITGGEPLLQLESMEVLANDLRKDSIGVQVETNGMLLSTNSLPHVDVVISPKAVHPTKGYLPIKRDWHDRASRYPTYLKYVLSADPESPYHTVPDDALDLANSGVMTVYVSGMCVYKKSPGDNEVSNAWDPEQVDQEETAKNYAYVASYAMTHGLNVSYQMHLFGNIP